MPNTDRVHRKTSVKLTAPQAASRNQKTVTVIFFDPTNDEPLFNFDLPAPIYQRIEQHRRRLKLSLGKYIEQAMSEKLDRLNIKPAEVA
jgi:hypothetical protein